MKLTGNQVFWMIMIMDLGMTLMMTLSPSLQAAKQDAWMSILVAGCISLLIAILAAKLSNLYPDQTLVQFSQTILGKWLGKIVIILYCVQWYTIIPIVLRQFNDLIESMLLPSTPKTIIISIMILLVVYAVYSGGIDGIGRYSEIMGPIVLLMVFAVWVASFNNIRWDNLMPFYADSGIKAILYGGLAPASYLGHAVEYTMLASFQKVPRKGTPYLYWAVIVADFCVLASMFMVILTVGASVSQKMWYPFFEMTKKISLFMFIENLDPFIVLIWLFSVFIKLSIYLWVTCYGTAQFLQMKNWKTLIWFVAPITVLFSLIPKNVSQATTNYLLHYWVPVVLPVNMIGLPLLMLIVGKIRQKKNPSPTS